MSAQKTYYAMRVRLCGDVPVIAGAARAQVTIGAIPGYDGVTRFGRLEDVDATHFRLAIYEDRARTVLFAASASKSIYDALPWTLTLTPSGADPWSFGVSAYTGEVDFTLFSGNEPQAGLYGGCLALITGPGYDGLVPFNNPPENPNNGEPLTRWRRGMIYNDGLGSPTNEVEFSEGGSYGVMSGGQIVLPNSVPESIEFGAPSQTLTSFLSDRDLSLVGCQTQRYVVLDDTFYEWGMGYTENPEVNELNITVPIIDPHPYIHRLTPHGTLDKQTYRTIPDDVQGKVMPLTIGNVLAKLIPLSAATNTTALARVGGRDLSMTRATAASGLTLTLYTPGMTFVDEDPRLLNKQIAVALAGVSGETYFSPFVKHVAATTDTNLTVVTMTDVFRKKDNTAATPVFGVSRSTWWFIVYDFTDFEAVNEGPVTSFVPSTSSPKPPVLGWDDATSRFFSLQSRLVTAYPGGGYAPYPLPAGLLLRPASDSIVPQVNHRPLLIPGALNMTASPAPATLPISGGDDVIYSKVVDTFPVGSVPAPVLFDQQRGAGYTRTWRITPRGLASSRAFDFIYNSGNVSPVAIFNVALPDDFVLGEDERLTIAMDSRVVLASQGSDQASYDASMKLVLLDEFGQEMVSGVLRRSGARAAPISPAPAPSGTTYENMNIGDEYYGEPPSAWQMFEVDVDGGGDIETILRNESYRKIVSFRIYVYVTFRVHFSNPTGAPVSYDCGYTIYQVAIVSTNADTYSGQKFVATVGVPFGDGWGDDRAPPRNASDPVLTPGDAIEYLIREQDKKPDFVNVDSLDAFRLLRSLPTWFTGMQMLEARSTFDWISDYAKAAFSVVFPGLDGRRNVGIIDRYFDAAAHPETLLEFDDVQDGSMGPAQLGLLDRVYTALDIQYDKNPQNDEYRKRIQILNEDRDGFPAIDETIPDSDPPVPLWTTWVTGLDAFDLNGIVVYSGAQYNANYAAASALWAKAHASYLRVGQRVVYEVKADMLRAAIDWYPGTLSSTEDAAFSLALLIADYLFVPWVFQSFSVPITPENITMIPMQRIGYGDEVRTDGKMYYALVKMVKLNTKSAVIEVVAARRESDTPYRLIGGTGGRMVLQDVVAGAGADEYDDESAAPITWRDG